MLTGFSRLVSLRCPCWAIGAMVKCLMLPKASLHMGNMWFCRFIIVHEETRLGYPTIAYSRALKIHKHWLHCVSLCGIAMEMMVETCL